MAAHMSDPTNRSDRPKRDFNKTRRKRGGESKAPYKGGGSNKGKPGGKPTGKGGRYKGKPGSARGGAKGGVRDGARKDGNRDGRDGGKPEGRGWSRPPRTKLTNAQAARKAAAMAVDDVLGRGFRLEGSLAKNPVLEDLDARDRGFARAIAATTLRRLGQIDAVLAPLVERPPPGRVQAYLQTATAQMIFMNVAPHAAVGDAVNLIKADSKSEPFAGLANAVLRKVADTGKADAARVPPTQNIPGWLRSEWTRLYGKPTVRRMALLLSMSPPLDISVKSDPQKWAETLEGQIIGDMTVRLDSIGNVTALDGFQDGAWWVQDMAAALPARILEQVCSSVSGKRVADLCAAPGGKSMQLCAMGAEVTAIDVSEARTTRLTQNLSRTGYDATVITSDLNDYEPDTLFDAVLLDAPCSATGTFRRRPDVLYNRRERDITPLTRLQDTLFKRAAKCVAPGGVLLYAVCSLQEREGAARVNKFLKAMPHFSLVKLSQIPGLDLSDGRLADGMLRILPPDAPDGRGLDGFFIALLRRTK